MSIQHKITKCAIKLRESKFWSRAEKHELLLRYCKGEWIPSSHGLKAYEHYYY